ncbi:MAG: metallophosphoesterase [Lachnospiraceae bacterium]|nr:metallophosphoesterase [Lachnospiraceae bacterium]
MWIAILAVAIGLTIAGAVYLLRRFRRFGIVLAIAGDRKWLQWLVAAAPLLGFAVYGLFDAVNAVIVVLHLAAFWLIADLVTGIAGLILRKKRGSRTIPAANGEEYAAGPVAGKLERADEAGDSHGTLSKAQEATGKRPFRVYWKGVAVIVVCTIYLAVGWYLAHHVVRTAYTVETDKSLPGGSLRIVQLSDSHVGTLFDGKEFAEHLRRVQAEQPDIVVFTGDFVDDNTSREDMVIACRALGELNTTYGVYFAYGNHDKGYYNSREYTAQELDAELRKNGITVLEDEVKLIAGSICIIGRKDRNEGDRRATSDGNQNGTEGKNGSATDGTGKTKGRMTMDEITTGLDRSCYMIVLDHQPNDYEAEAAADVDLVLSGHTHGGQLIPLGPIGILIGANDRTYGTETRGNTTFIVNSGIGDWAIDFKTGTVSEYVVIDVKSK